MACLSPWPVPTARRSSGSLAEAPGIKPLSFRKSVSQTAVMDAELRWSADVGPAGWIAPRLGPFGGSVGSTVPGGFEAYARVLHPVDANRSWADVCAETGARPHALMQWDAISRRVDRSGRTDGEDPREGHLDPEALRLLCRTLAPFTGSRQCWFALWEGWGWLDGGVAVLSSGAPAPPLPPALSRQELDGPKLELPHRGYHLFTGRLEAALSMGWTTPWGDFDPQSPSLFWPLDRSWCVATEVDFDSTLVGGSRQLIDDVLASDLETWEVRPDDSLASDGDTINTSLT